MGVAGGRGQVAGEGVVAGGGLAGRVAVRHWATSSRIDRSMDSRSTTCRDCFQYQVMNSRMTRKSTRARPATTNKVVGNSWFIPRA